MRFSTGLRNHLLATGSLRSALNNGVIHLYSGSAPGSADDAVPGGATLLVTVTDDGGGGGGLTFEAAAASGLLQKASSQVWKGTVTNPGLATWFRFVSASDTGTDSPTELRVQGTVGVGGTDMQISNPNLTVSADQKVDYFSIFQPE